MGFEFIHKNISFLNVFVITPTFFALHFTVLSFLFDKISNLLRFFYLLLFPGMGRSRLRSRGLYDYLFICFFFIQFLLIHLS